MSKPTKKDLELQVAQLTEALQRERADAENIRKRAKQENFAAFERGQAHSIEKLLPVFDGLDRAFAHAPNELADNKWAQGVLGLDKQLRSAMTEFGLERIETLNQEFDPELMEAVSSEGETNKVIEELQAGYRLNGEVIRVAMVRVG